MNKFIASIVSFILLSSPSFADHGKDELICGEGYLVGDEVRLKEPFHATQDHMVITINMNGITYVTDNTKHVSQDYGFSEFHFELNEYGYEYGTLTLDNNYKEIENIQFHKDNITATFACNRKK